MGHAYLFTGVRGTGKTTCAKIFAKAVNCLHPQNGDPCGECEICKGIDNGSILDVVEMDAASNNGVDDIRDLRDETAYTPSACQYKVYIIDEVHMLSTAAFNALLKTLEEPPAHVIFILATTEIQKVPATILSRCQRYDFTRIGPEDIAQRVEYIAGEEHLELTSDGAELIARLADGALRDALSILDTCAGVTAKIDADVVRRMAGVTDRSYLFRISDALEAQDGAAALAQLAQLRQQSVDVKRLTEELIAHYRALMLAALPGGQALLSGVSPEEKDSPAPSADDTNHSSKHSNDCYKKQSCINTGRTSHQYTRKHISSITVGSQYMFCTGWLLCHQKILYIRIIWTEFPGKSCCKKQDQCQYCKKDQFFSDMIFVSLLPPEQPTPAASTLCRRLPQSASSTIFGCTSTVLLALLSCCRKNVVRFSRELSNRIRSAGTLTNG